MDIKVTKPKTKEAQAPLAWHNSNISLMNNKLKKKILNKRVFADPT